MLTLVGGWKGYGVELSKNLCYVTLGGGILAISDIDMYIIMWLC